MSVYGRILLASLGSAALLLGALGFQYLAGLAPCTLCIWQRWPHLAAVLIGIAAMTLFWRQRRALSAAGAAMAALTAGIGAFHAGVEQGWWDGPAGCTGIDPAGMTPDQMLAALEAAPLVRCDDIAWQFGGLSMAAWNAALSLALAVLWVFAALPRTTTRHETRA